ncbi:MAG: TenA family protein [Synechococcales bacterium]|nr:TenA family protein [Synechococcales bacterium]
MTSLAKVLWDMNRDLAIACLESRFVQGIADGSLPKPKFAYYVEQDAFFLESFARAYSVAAAKTPDWQGFKIFHDLADGVLQELQLHQGYAKAWEVDLQKAEPGTATRHYTDFLSAIVWSQEVGVTTAAMLPCMQLYGFLGQQLAASGIPDHAYADWIRTYSSDEFTPLVEQLVELSDRYTLDTPTVQSVYRYAMQCELNFFEAAWTAE